MSMDRFSKKLIVVIKKIPCSVGVFCFKMFNLYASFQNVSFQKEKGIYLATHKTKIILTMG